MDKCISIRIEFDDGEVLSQEGEAADNVWKWYRGAEGMYCIHGAEFKGEPLKSSKGTSKTTQDESI